LQEASPHAWTLNDPHLYDLQLELLDADEIVDSVILYAGLCKLHIKGHKFFINNEPSFLRFALD